MLTYLSMKTPVQADPNTPPISNVVLNIPASTLE